MEKNSSTFESLYIYAQKLSKQHEIRKPPLFRNSNLSDKWKFLKAVEIWQSFKPALASHNCQKFITFGEPKSNWLATRYLERYSLPQCSDCILILFTKWNKPIFILQRRKVWFGC